MSKKHLFLCAAACAVAYFWGQQRGLATAAASASAGPVVGTTGDWMGWQGV